MRPPWLIDRDLDAVAAYLDAWILAAEPDHDPQTTAVPLLGTPEWVAADEVTRNASVALYVLACLAEREPVVIAARLAAEIAAGTHRVSGRDPAVQPGDQQRPQPIPIPPAAGCPMTGHPREPHQHAQHARHAGPRGAARDGGAGWSR